MRIYAIVVTAAIAIVSLAMIIFILNSSIIEGMTIRDIQVSEHADELDVLPQIPSFEPGSIITMGHWKKDVITISFFPRDLDEQQSNEIIQYLKDILSSANMISSNNTSWPPVLSNLSKTSDGVPTLKIIEDGNNAADIKAVLEGTRHPEGKIGYAMISRDSNTAELTNVEITLFSAHDLFLDGSINPIFAHELGHALGLGHATSMSSIMHNRLVIVDDEFVGKIRDCEADALYTLYGIGLVKDLEC